MSKKKKQERRQKEIQARKSFKESAEYKKPTNEIIIASPVYGHPSKYRNKLKSKFEPANT